MPDRPRFVDRSLVLRVRIYVVIALVALVLAVIDIVRIGGGAVLPVLGGFVVAVAVGLVVSRMFALSWDAANGKVIGRIDAVGAVILVLYVLVSIFRGQVVALWFDGPLAAAVGVAVLAGLMAGQVVGTGRGVRRVVLLATRGAEPA